jgi:hypothetical protein
MQERQGLTGREVHDYCVRMFTLCGFWLVGMSEDISEDPATASMACCLALPWLISNRRDAAMAERPLKTRERYGCLQLAYALCIGNPYVRPDGTDTRTHIEVFEQPMPRHMRVPMEPYRKQITCGDLHSGLCCFSGISFCAAGICCVPAGCSGGILCCVGIEAFCMAAQAVHESKAKNGDEVPEGPLSAILARRETPLSLSR